MSLSSDDAFETLNTDGLRRLVVDLSRRLHCLEDHVTHLTDQFATVEAARAAPQAENQELRDGIARLKNLPPRPPFKPSGMEKATSSELGNPGGTRRPRGPKRDTDRVSREEVLTAEAPAGSRFKGYETFQGRDPSRGLLSSCSKACPAGVLKSLASCQARRANSMPLSTGGPVAVPYRPRRGRRVASPVATEPVPLEEILARLRRSCNEQAPPTRALYFECEVGQPRKTQACLDEHAIALIQRLIFYPSPVLPPETVDNVPLVCRGVRSGSYRHLILAQRADLSAPLILK